MMYATKRRRRSVKPVKPPMKDPPKSNPSKRHRERLNSELDHLASLLPFEQSVISKLDKLSVLRLAASYFRIKSYFRAALHERYGLTPSLHSHSHASHPMAHSHHIYAEPAFVDNDSVLQACSGFMFMVTADGEVFFASRTVEQYLGFHQSDIIHQSVLELIHSEDREEFKNQLNWRSQLPQDQQDMTVQQVMMPENSRYLARCFTVRFRCLLDNTSGFITLEISGKMKYLHGQSLKNDNVEPPWSLFAMCCPFGPVPMLDMPPRDYTFKSKHKMDMAPVSMDPRGKILFGYSDQELMERGGYDLIHPDDLNYYAAAHHELIKTGSSGLIAYRLMTKDFRWIWLQTSSKVVYKNSKPDFVICTHRHLTEDEGKDLFGKRGSEFKLPYPIIDADPSGFGAALEEEDMSKVKTGKKKSKTQLKDYLQAGRKRKTPYREVYNGLNGYSSAYSGLNAYSSYGMSSEMKNEFLSYPAGTNPLSLETAADVYRNAYPSFATPPVYPTTDSLARLDMDRHGYTNGYFYDSVTRPYQHTLQYPSNGYSDLVSSHPKYGYDVSKYGYESFMGSGYSLDLSKRNSYYDTSKYDSYSRGYDTQSGVSDSKLARLNGSSYDTLRKSSSSSLYETSPVMNSNGLLQCGGGDATMASPTTCSINNSDLTSRHNQSLSVYNNNHHPKEEEIGSDYQTTANCGGSSNNDCGKNNPSQQQHPHAGYASVIRSTSPRGGKSSPPTTYGNIQPSTTPQDCGEMNVNGGGVWPSCNKAQSPIHNGGVTSNLHISSSVSSDSTSNVSSDPSPSSVHTPVIIDHTDNRACSTDPIVINNNTSCRGIAVPVLRSSSSSSWLHHQQQQQNSHHLHSNNSIHDHHHHTSQHYQASMTTSPTPVAYDANWHIPANGAGMGVVGAGACGESSVLAHTRGMMEPSKHAILRDGENPLLSFSQVSHTLLSTG